MSADGEGALEVTQNENKNCNEEFKEPNLWKEFRLSIPNFFSDEKISKKHIEEFLHNIVNNKDTVTVLFVPHSTAGCESQHYEQLKSYTDFTVWFIGQLLRMLCTDKLSYAHKLSLAAQSTLLSIFADKSIEMLRRVMLEYTKYVTELLNAINGFYINKSKSEYNIDCFMYNFIVTSRGKCWILLEKILVLIKSQCCILSECSLDLISTIWSIVLKVLSNINSITITTAVQLAATLIKNGELPSICDVAVLCEKISLLFQFVTNAFYKNKKVSQANSLISHLLIAFSDLFNAFSSLSYHSLKKIANFLLKMLSSLLKQKSPFITSELVASSTCQLLCTLLTVHPVEDLIIDVKDLNQLMNDIQCCQNIMPVVKIFCQNEIIKHFKDSKEHCRQTGERVTVVQANEMSITLNNILNLLANNTNSVNHLSKENFYNLLKLMNAVAKLVSDLSSVCDEYQNCTGNDEKPILSFFGENFYKDFISMTAAFTDKLVMADFEGVNYLFEISSVLLTLPEINIISVTIVKQLIAFQSLPWWKYSFLFELDLCGTSFQDTIEAFINHQDSVFQVDRVKKLCLRTLGQIPCDIDIGWRLQLLSRYFNDNESDGADVLRCVPFMLYNCRSIVSSLVDSLLQPALSSSNPCVQSAVPDVISLVLCVLSGSAHLVRLLNCEGFNVKCKECDLSEEQDAAVSCNQIRPLLNGFLNLFTAASPQVLCKVITVLPKLANHLPFIHTPDCVKRWILFVKNPNVHVRDVFSKVVVDLVFRRKWVERKKLHCEEDLPLSQADRLELVHSEPLLESFNKQVMSAVQLSLINKDTSLQLTIMSTIRSMGCAPVDCVIYPCVRMLLIFISHPYSVKPSIAQVHLQAIAEAHNKRVLDIFEKYRGEFCKLIIDILMLYSPEDKKDLMCFVQQLAYGLTYYSCRSFLAHNTSDYLLKYLLASLINKPQLDWMLEYFAEFTGTTVSVLLSEGFQHIYPYLYMEADEAVLKDCCKYMESITGLKIQTLICLSFKRITIEILLYYNTNKDKVMQGLNFLMQLADEGQSSSDGDVVKFLANRFLGVLNFMEGVLVSKHVSDTDKRNILLTLPDIIRLLGPTHNTPVRLKVLAMLRAALTVCHGFFPDLTCAAWEAFIYNVEVAALGSLLSTIFVSLLPLLNNFPDEIKRMLHYLVIENEDTLNDYFDELFFVPDLDSIHDIYNIIQTKIKQKINNMSFIEQLQSTLNVAKHENVEVRLHGLKKLRLQVITNWTAISDLIINNDSLHPVIIDFLDTLITGTRDEEERIRIACGECLGELGALDPGRLPNNLLVKNVYHKGHLQLNTSDFAYSALMVLVKGFQEARYTVSMDEIAFAIQELLKIYKISPVSKDIWNRFPVSVQERMLPFLNSWYMHNTSVDKSITDLLPHPVFGSYRGKTMMSWAYNWACFLIPLVLQDFAQQVFRACQFSFKKDTSIMMFFLPYILLYALLSCSENHKKMIEEEIKAVICYSDEDSQREVDGRKATLYKVRKDCVTNDKFSDKEDGTTQMMCIKIIYSLLDFLYQWLRETKKHFSITKKVSADFSSTNYDTVSEFLERFSLMDIAKGSFNCQEYSRSLLYMEEYVVKNPDKLEELLPSIGKIYSQLNEPDGLRGVIASHQHEPTPNEILLYHEITGRLHDAATCYEHLAALEAQQSAQCDKNVVKGMVGCYLSMDQPFTALHLSESLLARISQFLITHDLHGEQAEALWSLGRMDQLEAMFQDHSELNYNDSWGINIAQAMVHLKQHNESLMLSKLNILRKSLVERLLSRSAMSSGGYKQGYDYIVRLHILNEFEKIGKLVLNLPSDMDNCDSFDNEDIKNGGLYLEKQFKKLVAMEFDQRLKLLQPSSRVLQPVLGMRRVLLSLAENMVPANNPSVHSCLKQEIGKSWLKSIAVARKSNNFQQAYSNILSAEQLKPNGLFIEKAKLHWAKLEKDTALTALKRGIEQTFPLLVASADINSSIAQLSIDDRKLLAKARLLIATYNDQNVEMETNLSCYIEAVEARRDWEKSIICLAQFQYKIFISYDDIQKQSVEGLECQEKLVKYFGKSLQYGCKYIYQSMPRMLSIWLEFGAQLANNSSKSSSAASSSNQIANIIEQKKTMIKLNKLIEGFIDKLPLFMFMTSYSQLLSRICHPQNDCYNLLKKILARIIKSYPEQSLWLFIAASKSKHALRVKRCEELLNEQIIQSDKKLLNFISCMNQLHNCLIEFSNRECSAKETVSFSSLNKKLPRLLKESSFCQILLPLQKFMTVSLPRSVDYSDHNPYPLKMVYIHSVKEEVTVLRSLQKPKKFTVVGSDGLEYFMMVKANDDLRFDARLMDFFNIINMYLQCDAEGRDRRLHIRTYSVLALNENSGLIEWISNLSTYRNVIQNLYQQMNIKVNDLQNNYYNINVPLQQKRQHFANNLLKKYPPVLRKWFLQEFPHPVSWYQARTAYVRTAAVMSIVGYMVGLGDRHNDNILLDICSGEVMHVDFNCCCNIGEEFQWPERVPFRLTHNMVDAMGPTGYEGMFIQSCEITNHVMRQQREQLISVLKPLIYDSLIKRDENKLRKKIKSGQENCEMTNELNVKRLKDIKLRLEGSLRIIPKNKYPAIGKQSQSLSVEGQTRSLIHQATDIDNLCQMYVGWTPFF